MWIHEVLDRITDEKWASAEACLSPHTEGETEVVGEIPPYVRSMYVMWMDLTSQAKTPVTIENNVPSHDREWLLDQADVMQKLMMIELGHVGMHINKNTLYVFGAGWKLLRVIPKEKPIIIVPDQKTVMALGAGRPTMPLPTPKRPPSVMRVGV